MVKWQRVEPTKVTETDYRQIVTKRFRMPDGIERDFDTYNQEGIEYAGVIVVDKNSRIVSAEMFRPGPEKIFTEIAGGRIDPGETPKKAAIREMKEEVCYKPGKIEYLGRQYKDAFINGIWHYFLATECEKLDIPQKLDAEEYINVKLLSIDEFIQNAFEGKVTDSQAVLLAYDRLKDIKEKFDA